ncbi:MAG: GIY-YIG nuclease family protein [Bacteroidetes bacterium]|nr:GIY-YIG nuclease family protein [Bacteroidota bacterium]
MSWVVYILECSDGLHYVGCTSNLLIRLSYHEKGRVSFTSTRLPVSVIIYLTFNNKYRAYQFEKYLKSGSGRAFMKKRFL